MITIVGNKEIFAVEFDGLELTPGFNCYVKIWINNVEIGDFTEISYFSSVLHSLSNIIYQTYSRLWVEELDGLSCKDIFYTITPCYNDPESFFDLSESEMDALIKYDRFLFNWGDAFNDWYLKVVVNEDICKFLWVHTPLGDDDSFDVRNKIKCFDVELKVVKDVYDQLAKFIPNELWPTLITR